MANKPAPLRLRLAMTCAVMDLLHTGHINLFERMRERADLVLVLLHDGFTTFKNKKKLPIENLQKRTRNLIDSGLVDIIKYTFEEQPDFTNILKQYEQFDITFYRGDDWQAFPGKESLKETPIVYLPYTKGISSTILRNEL